MSTQNRIFSSIFLTGGAESSCQPDCSERKPDCEYLPGCMRLQCDHQAYGDMLCSAAPELGSRSEVPDGIGMRIGLALRSKKLKRYATPNVLKRAADAGADIILIDRSVPLEHQGPFNVIVHKLVPADPFYNELESYVRMHPHTRVIDEVKRVRLLQTRDDMLRVFCENHMSTFRPEKAQPAANSSLAAAKERFYASGSTSASSIHEQTGSGAQHSPRVCTFSAPKQVVVPANTPLADIVTKLSAAGVQFPVISKPIASDGTDGSHALTLFLSSQALQALVDPDTHTAPEGVVLQQFEEHGGVLFKVYVLGSMCEVKLRPSLQLPPEVEKLDSCRSGWIVLPRFSTTPIAEHDAAQTYGVSQLGAVDENGVGLETHNTGTPGSSPGICAFFVSPTEARVSATVGRY